MKRTTASETLLLLLLALTVGCASGLAVEARGIQKEGGGIPSTGTYIVLPSEGLEKDPNFPKYADVVAQEMSKRGYRVSDEKSAQLAVFLAYLVTDTARGASRSLSPEEMASAGGAGSGTGYRSSGSSAELPDLHRFRTQVVVVVADLKRSLETGDLVELWRGESRTSGRKPDLSRVLPFMVDAAFRHFGETTSSSVRHTFQDAPSVR